VNYFLFCSYLKPTNLIRPNQLIEGRLCAVGSSIREASLLLCGVNYSEMDFIVEIDPDKNFNTEITEMRESALEEILSRPCSIYKTSEIGKFSLIGDGQYITTVAANFISTDNVLNILHDLKARQNVKINPYNSQSEPFKRGLTILAKRLRTGDQFTDVFHNSSDEKLKQELETMLSESTQAEEKNAWSSDVETHWHPSKPGFFKQPAIKIAKGLKHHSKDERQALARLNFYTNRAGKNLSKKDTAELDKAKKLLQQSYHQKRV